MGGREHLGEDPIHLLAGFGGAQLLEQPPGRVHVRVERHRQPGAVVQLVEFAIPPVDLGVLQQDRGEVEIEGLQAPRDGGENAVHHLAVDLAATLLAIFGVFMTAVGVVPALLVWAYALAFFLVNDLVKVALFRRIHPYTAPPVDAGASAG